MGIFWQKKKKDDFVLQLFGFGWENTGQIYLDPENDKKKKRLMKKDLWEKNFVFCFLGFFFSCF